jgi:hypothetical protein
MLAKNVIRYELNAFVVFIEFVEFLGFVTQ